MAAVTSDRAISQSSTSPTRRESADAGRSPGVLHNLSQRFRKGSNASSNTSDSLNQTAETPTTTTTKQSERARANASRAAKRYLMTIVRNDWEFPQNADESPRPDAKEPTAWRLRDAGSDDEPEHHTSPTKKRSKSDPYRFENPDAVADYVRERQVKRRKVLLEQMQWNKGLQHWVDQRDAWTGALWKHPHHQTRQDSAEVREAKQNTLGLILEKGDITDSTSTTATSLSSSVNETGPPADSHQPRYTPGTAVLSTPPHSPTGTNSNPNTSSSSLEHTTTITATTTTEPSTSAATGRPNTAVAIRQPPDPKQPGPYLPIYPPLFPPDNVLRSRIQPSAYSAIYSKIVVQCLTPNIPIPLPDMVRALVAGWKEEGQWPPQGTPLPPGAQGSGKRLGSFRGDGPFARWRRERVGRKNVAEGGVVDLGALGSGVGGGRGGGTDALGTSVDGVGAEDGDTNAGRGHRVRRSISIVKRALGMEGVEAELKRRQSEVGLSMGFEEEDYPDDVEVGEGGVVLPREADDADRKLNENLLAGA